MFRVTDAEYFPWRRKEFPAGERDRPMEILPRDEDFFVSRQVTEFRGVCDARRIEWL
jgi:hypothetical protein